MNSVKDSETALYVVLNTESHTRLKTYGALTKKSMRELIEEWIQTLNFDNGSS